MITIGEIQRRVAEHYSLRLADLNGSRKFKGVVRPRMIAMYLSRRLTRSSYPAIGKSFGGRDHTTVMNACRRVPELMARDSALLETVCDLQASLHLAQAEKAMR